MREKRINGAKNRFLNVHEVTIKPVKIIYKNPKKEAFTENFFLFIQGTVFKGPVKFIYINKRGKT